ncbi:MAG: sugar phosphate isomerase/epimerase family protein [Armatimonadota bacterium]
MRTSLCGAGLGAARLSFFDFAELASATGFDGFDFGAQGALDAVNEVGLAAVQTRLAELHVVPAVFGLDVEWRGSDEKFEEGMLGFTERVAAAVAVGCDRCCTWIPPASDVTTAEWTSRTVSRFKRIMVVLNAHGVRLGLEFVGPHHLRAGGANAMGSSPTLWTLEQTLAMIDVIGLDGLGLLVDSYHLDTTSTDAAALIPLGDALIVHAHINDAGNDTTAETALDGNRVLPGAGRLPLQHYVDVLKAVGYSGFLCCEVLTPTPLGPTPAAAATNIRESLRKLGV